MNALSDYVVFQWTGYHTRSSVRDAPEHYRAHLSMCADEDGALYEDYVKPREIRDPYTTDCFHFKKSNLKDISRIEALRWKILGKLRIGAKKWQEAAEMIRASGGVGYVDRGDYLTRFEATRDGISCGSGRPRLAPNASTLERLAAEAYPSKEQLASGNAYYKVRKTNDTYRRRLFVANVTLFAALSGAGLISPDRRTVVKINGRWYPCITSYNPVDAARGLDQLINPSEVFESWPALNLPDIEIVEV